MSYNVICDSSDIRIAYNTIQNYTNDLAKAVGDYSKILKQVQEYAIEDNLINASLTQLESEISPKIRDLQFLVDTAIKTMCNREISEIAAADDFQYPGELLYSISSLLSIF